MTNRERLGHDILQHDARWVADRLNRIQHSYGSIWNDFYVRLVQWLEEECRNDE